VRARPCGRAAPSTALYTPHVLTFLRARPFAARPRPSQHFVGLFHPKGDDYPQPLPDMTIDFQKHFGYAKGTSCTVRNLWTQEDVGTFTDTYTRKVGDTAKDEYSLLSVAMCSGGADVVVVAAE
jgi:hypothetical protein